VYFLSREVFAEMERPWSPGLPVTVVVKKEDSTIMQNCQNESSSHLALSGFELLLSTSHCKYKNPLVTLLYLIQKDHCLQPAVWQLYFYEVNII
jgi:hypothetical protein